VATLTAYQAKIVDECRKVARRRSDPRPGMPRMTYPLSVQAQIDEIVAAGALTVVARPLTRNPAVTVHYLVPTD
jgi:hypothetical protein